MQGYRKYTVTYLRGVYGARWNFRSEIWEGQFQVRATYVSKRLSWLLEKQDEDNATFYVYRKGPRAKINALRRVEKLIRSFEKCVSSTT